MANLNTISGGQRLPAKHPFGTADYQRGNIDIAGDVYFVHATRGDNESGNGRSPASPLASLEYAINQATASQGDTIYLLPGHTESVASATALNLDKAGIDIVGLGWGSVRPIITLTTATTATLPVTAANIRMRNIVFHAGFADIVSLFTVTGNNFIVEDCLIRQSAADLNFLHVFDTSTTDNSADGLTFRRNRWFSQDAATIAFMLLDSAVDRMAIEDNLMVTGHATQDVAFLITGATGKNMTNVSIRRNEMFMTGHADTTAGLLITTDATAGTGIISYNNLKHLDATTEILITATHTFGLFENRVTAVANAQGFLRPAVDS